MLVHGCCHCIPRSLMHPRADVVEAHPAAATAAMQSTAAVVRARRCCLNATTAGSTFGLDTAKSDTWGTWDTKTGSAPANETIKSGGTHGTGGREGADYNNVPSDAHCCCCCCRRANCGAVTLLRRLGSASEVQGTTLATHRRPHDRQDAQRGVDVPLEQQRIAVAADQAPHLASDTRFVWRLFPFQAVRTRK
jgi:hypothetical protein